MNTRKAKPNLSQRTSLAEWVAAALGLVLTVSVVSYTLWDGLTEDDGPPHLTATAGKVVRTGSNFVLPIILRNSGPSTAADVEVVGVLSRLGQSAEERHATFAYAPGNGEAHGGLVFENDPTHAVLTIQGFADP